MNYEFESENARVSSVYLTVRHGSFDRTVSENGCLTLILARLNDQSARSNRLNEGKEWCLETPNRRL